jgi:uncharacterized membrane protein (UPF0127 family)
VLVFVLFLAATTAVVLRTNSFEKKFLLGEEETPPDTVPLDYTHHASIAGVDLAVEVADTEAKRAQGLSYRRGLETNQGMLFVFEREDTYKFWMKDMNFPIDMIWFSADKKVTYIEKDAQPESYPEAFGPDSPALYVLEVVSGFSDAHHIKIGDVISFTE